MSKTLRSILFLSDLHAPYHNKPAWKLFLRVARELDWWALVSIGDFYDQYCISRYVKDPRKMRDFYREIQAGRTACLDPLNKIGFHRKIVTLGNHDIRHDTFLRERAPELYNQCVNEDWLGFASTGWQVVPYQQHTTLGKLLLSHEVGATGAHAVLNAVQDNIVTGHDHRMCYVVQGTATGVLHVSATFGWLGDAEHASYMHSIRQKRNWAPGFGYGYLEPNGVIHLRPAPIIARRVVVEGRLFTL